MTTGAFPLAVIEHAESNRRGCSRTKPGGWPRISPCYRKRLLVGPVGRMGLCPCLPPPHDRM
jgi:hypothetical protein